MIVRIKPLVWETLPDGQLRAKTPFGDYYIQPNNTLNSWVFDARCGLYHWRASKTVEQSKEEVNKHYLNLLQDCFESPWQSPETLPKDVKVIVLDDEHTAISAKHYRDNMFEDDYGFVDVCVAWMEQPPYEEKK